MAQLAIRCHPSIPVPADELERWLVDQVEALRVDHRVESVRLLRLTQPLPTTDVETGWLVEFELPDADLEALEARLTEALRDMRLLGFQPTLLAPLHPPVPDRAPGGRAVRALAS